MNIKNIAVINPLLKDYIAYYYILTTTADQQPSNYIAYPSIHIPLCFLDQCEINIDQDTTVVAKGNTSNLRCIIVGHSSKPVYISLQNGIQEFCIAFKPLGLNYLTRKILGSQLNAGLKETNEFDFLKDSVKAVLNDDSKISQLENIIIDSLHLSKELQLLGSFIHYINENEMISFKELTSLFNVPYKNIYRLFNKHLGVSPVQYRRIIKFRTALMMGVNPEYKHKMSTIAVESGYFDQAHYINEFKKISNLTPKNFISSIWIDRSKKVIWKMQ